MAFTECRMCGGWRVLNVTPGELRKCPVCDDRIAALERDAGCLKTAATVIADLCETLDLYGPGDTGAERRAKAFLNEVPAETAE